MNDTLREYLSYGQLIVPILKIKKNMQPEEVNWGDRDQYFLYYPSPCKKADTLVVYIHGGGWNAGSPKDFYFIGQKIALEGFDCMMLGYRKASKYHYPEISEDIFEGYVKLREHLKRKGCKHSKTVIMGSSAGAHLGALLCFDRERQAQHNIQTDEFDGFISLAGPLCFDYPQTGACNQLMKNFFGDGDSLSWKVGDPSLKLKEYQKTKLLLIQSKHDGIIGFEQAKAFADKAESLHMSIRFYEVQEKQNTHSAYSAGIFLKDRKDSPTLEQVFHELEGTDDITGLER